MVTSMVSNQTRQQKIEKKWVQNLSSTPLTKDQESLLSHGPKCVITPKQTPVSEYITAIEQSLYQAKPRTARGVESRSEKSIKEGPEKPSEHQQGRI